VATLESYLMGGAALLVLSVIMSKATGHLLGVPSNPVEGLSLLQNINPPAFILLSSQELPLITYQQFINIKNQLPPWAHVPVILLSLVTVGPLPKGLITRCHS